MNKLFKISKYFTSGNFLTLLLKWFLFISTLLLLLMMITCGLMIFNKEILIVCGNIPIYFLFITLSILLSIQASLFCLFLREN